LPAIAFEGSRAKTIAEYSPAPIVTAPRALFPIFSLPLTHVLPGFPVVILESLTFVTAPSSVTESTIEVAQLISVEDPTSVQLPPSVIFWNWSFQGVSTGFFVPFVTQSVIAR
jgi:hypothetical protein